MICSKNDDLNLKKDINYLIMAYLSSHNEQERMWGIIGKTVQIDLLLQSRESNRESLMQAYLDDIERCLQGDAPLRSAFYRLFAQVLQNNGRSMPSPYILKWADVKETMFKKEFFVDKTAGVESTSALESEKFVRKECGFWLQPPPERMRELVAFFELLKEVSMMKRRWNTDEDSFNANVNHFAAFFYAFEANISMEAVTSLKEIDKIKATVDYLFFVNDWIRMLLNTFSSRSSVPGHPDEVIQEIWTKKFFLLFECEKQINTRIKQIEKWTLPTESTTDCFVVRQQAPKNSSKKKVERRGKKRPRESDEHNSMNEPINSPEPEEMFVDITTSLSDAKTRKPLTFIDLKDFNFHLRPLKLAAVVRLILMVDEKRKSTLFLLDELLRILRDQISKKEKKPGIWLHKNNKPKVSSDYHGDHTTVWKLVKKCIPVVWKIANSMTKFFEEQLETSIVDRHDPAILAQTSQLLARCLQIVHAIFSSSETARPRENEEGFTSRRNKRSEMIETLEKSIMDMQEQEENESPDEAEEDPEHRISQIFFKMAHVALSSEVAIAVLDAFSCFDVASPDMSLKMAKSALGYLRREWSDEEGNALKGPSLSNAAKSILDHYIRLRRDEKQLTAIHSLLSDKIASLVPKGEKEKNNAYGALPQDDELDEDDMRGNFACINVKTFPAIYKVLFRWVNVCMSRKNMRSNVIRNGSHTEEQVLNMWDSAAACFSLLCLFLRVPQLRALPALTTAVREGKRFLTLIAKNNSFTYLLEDLPQGARFIAIEPRISKIIRAVQMGNGVLQNIGVYAKTKKCNNLLKALPELRGASEMCLRHMHTIMVANNCTDAFDIGMMKSRNLDGKVMEVEQSEDSDAESENDPAQNDGNQDEEGNDDENDDGEDSDSRESAVF
ncbi:unnamed protein product [Caenorhabditis auriculariae]|uniref:Uncharacterized protein n=1 Tax=Caenorhabditis auriculariae TaxID=2777116 RepID=A0A8S1H113_9PELO|nr:unnamed protein product [Caenorhabditis auriculariae]